MNNLSIYISEIMGEVKVNCESLNRRFSDPQNFTEKRLVEMLTYYNNFLGTFRLTIANNSSDGFTREIFYILNQKQVSEEEFLNYQIML